MTDEQLEKERARFEAHFAGWDIKRSERDSWHGPTGTYLDDLVDVMFKAWLARAEQDQALRAAAADVVKRWDLPLWNDAGPTAGFIYKMRDLL